MTRLLGFMRGPLISSDSTGRSFEILSHERAGRVVERPTTERLFHTAAGLFYHKGYAATTTREIATAVGIQQASLYHHMASDVTLLTGAAA
jgi:hypothetical protein